MRVERVAGCVDERGKLGRWLFDCVDCEKAFSFVSQRMVLMVLLWVCYSHRGQWSSFPAAKRDVDDSMMRTQSENWRTGHLISYIKL